MLVEWRKGLSSARTNERLQLCQLEERSRRFALELECAERCAEHPLGIADCADLVAEVVSFRWCRTRTHLLARVMVHVKPEGGLQTLNVKCKRR